MKIAIVGAGRIGSTFGLYLARAGHDVTLIARGKRLEELQRDPAIVPLKGERAPVAAAGTLDGAVAWDLVLVTVLAHQVDAVLPALQASAAKSVMFMFNTFEPVARLREAVGAARFVFAFPMVIAHFVDGKLKSTVNGPGMATTVSSEAWAQLFKAAQIPSVVEHDMDSWLRSHVAAVAPLMALGCAVRARQRGLAWSEAAHYARAMAEASALVRQLGHRIIPGGVALLSRLPSFVATALLWLGSRTTALRVLGALGPAEPQQLIDAMTAAAPDHTQALQQIRPV